MLRKLNLLSVKYYSLRNSSLFVNGVKASETYVHVQPHVEYPLNEENKQMLVRNLKRRKSQVDIERIEDIWDVYQKLLQQKSNYDRMRSSLSKKISDIIKRNPNNDEINKYKTQLDLVKDNLKKIKEPLWSAEESAVLEYLNIPNSIHRLTPETHKVIYRYLEKPTCKKNHMDYQQLIDIKSSNSYYLKGEAVIFELGVQFYISKLLKKHTFIQFSNTDFVKSLVVEGCGINHTDPDSSFILHHQEDSKMNIDARLHLTGGASLTSFIAYHTKNIIYPKYFPLKYFTMGRQYNPVSRTENLFHVNQSNAVEWFLVTRDSEELDIVLDTSIKFLKDIFDNIGLHYQLTLKSSDSLKSWESLRLSVEMFSTSQDAYIEIGNLSVSGDYISKRLIFTYMDNKETKFPYLLSGTLINVPRFLACMLEQNEDFKIPAPFLQENW